MNDMLNHALRIQPEENIFERTTSKGIVPNQQNDELFLSQNSSSDEESISDEDFKESLNYPAENSQKSFINYDQKSSILLKQSSHSESRIKV